MSEHKIWMFVLRQYENHRRCSSEQGSNHTEDEVLRPPGYDILHQVGSQGLGLLLKMITAIPVL